MEWRMVWLTGGEEGERVQGCQVSEKSSRKVGPSFFLLLILFLFIFTLQPRLQVDQKQTGREKSSLSLSRPSLLTLLTWRCSHCEPLHPAQQRGGEGENLVLTSISTDSIYAQQRNNDSVEEYTKYFSSLPDPRNLYIICTLNN